MRPEQRQRDYTAVKDMLEALREAREHVVGLTKQSAFESKHPRDAALYRIFVLGEAATRVSDDLRDAHIDVPWSDIIGMRNVLIHGYEKVNWDVVWKTIEEDFNTLEPVLERVLRSLR